FLSPLRGLGGFVCHDPSDESLGYCRSSLRDFCPVPITSQRSGSSTLNQQLATSLSDIVQKLWGFCHTLRHDGVDYGDYIEQLTYLLFLKMADERSAKVPKGS